MTSGGHEVGVGREGPHSNNILDFTSKNGLSHTNVVGYPPTPEWIITVDHRPNSEQNLPKAERFSERADTVATTSFRASQYTDAIGPPLFTGAQCITDLLYIKDHNACMPFLTLSKLSWLDVDVLLLPPGKDSRIIQPEEKGYLLPSITRKITC